MMEALDRTASSGRYQTNAAREHIGASSNDRVSGFEMSGPLGASQGDGLRSPPRSPPASASGGWEVVRRGAWPSPAGTGQTVRDSAMLAPVGGRFWALAADESEVEEDSDPATREGFLVPTRPSLGDFVACALTSGPGVVGARRRFAPGGRGARAGEVRAWRPSTPAGRGSPSSGGAARDIRVRTAATLLAPVDSEVEWPCLTSSAGAGRAAEEEERACTTPLPKLPMACGRATLIKGSHSSYYSNMVLNLPPVAMHLNGP